jgi:hypothetical protein
MQRTKASRNEVFAKDDGWTVLSRKHKRGPGFRAWRLTFTHSITFILGTETVAFKGLSFGLAERGTPKLWR